MVRQCALCRKIDYLNPDVSFHSIPANPDIRKNWLEILEFPDNKPLPKVPFLCSDHFEIHDFVYKSNGVKYLRRGAIPHRVKVTDSKIHDSEEWFSSGNVSVKAWTQISENIPSTSSSPPKRFLSAKVKVENLSPGDPILLEERFLSPIVKVETLSPGDSSLLEERFSSPQVENLSLGDPSLLKKRSPQPHQQNSSCLYISDSEENSDLETRMTGLTDSTSAIAEPQDHHDTITIDQNNRKKYIEDLDLNDFSCPIKAKNNFKVLKGVVNSQRKKIKSLNDKVRRLKSRVSTLNDCIKELKQRLNITDSSETAIEASVLRPTTGFFEKMLSGAPSQNYKSTKRLFALTLALYSASAYNLIRGIFNKSLPHIKTISRWFTSVGGSPGFTQKSLKTFKVKRQKADKNKKKILCRRKPVK